VSQFSAGPNGAVPPVQDQALWLWDKTNPLVPVVSGYPLGNGVYSQTKTGLTPADLQNFVGVPLQYYGNPPVPVPPSVLQEWIRYAEDSVEEETSILLCQCWVASPPAVQLGQTEQTGLIVNNTSGYQIRGYDYDRRDSAYDFMFSRAQDEAWMIQQLRFRPVQDAEPNNPANPTAIKNVAYVYPLLNTYFRIPRTWFVEDQDYGLARFVPSQNVQMLPLFVMQLAFMGFAENVPGAFWFQYTAGLTDYDYSSRWAFMKELVLTIAAIRALSSIQGTINLGVKAIQLQVDGLLQRREYDVKGPYAGLIAEYKTERNVLMKRAMTRVSGPMITTL
jgi:hypothetical protein